MITQRARAASMQPRAAGAAPAPAIATLRMYQGDDYAASIYVTLGGLPADLTGWTPRAQIRRDVADRSPVIVAEFAAVMTDALHGHISISLLHTITAALSGRYVWDVQVTSPAGMVQTLIAGVVTVLPEVTR